MTLFSLPRRDWPLLVTGALLLVLAYPPFHLFLPSFVCLIPAVWLILRANDDPRPLRRQLVQGFWFGFLGHGLVLYWIVVALWHFTPLSALGYFATIAIFALYTAGLFAGTGWVVRRTGLSVVLVFPVGWTLVEWFIGHQGDIRFPWLGLGTSLSGYPTVIQLADIMGARGLTLLLAVANAALAVAWLRRRERTAWRIPVIVGLGVLAATGYGEWRMRTVPLRAAGQVALVQPNVGFQDKWDAALQDSIFNHLMDVSGRAMRRGDPDLAVWPEAAVPGWFFQRPSWEFAITEQASRHDVPVIVGGLDYHRYGDAEHAYDYWNAAFYFTPDGGRADAAYHKRFLVPITERVPFVNPRWFDMRFFGGFSVGETLPVFATPVGRAGVLICYESAFEELPRAYRRTGAEVLVNITNDAWFGESSAPYQHFAHLVLRAIETRMGIARAANTGISGFVDPLGRPRHRTALGEETVLTATLITSDAVPLYVRLGDWVGLLTVLTALALAALAFRRRP